MVVGTTTMTQMINPEVLADMINATLPKLLRFSPLATVDTTLQGQPGNTLKFPAWTYIGAAADVAEGVAIPLDQMATSTKNVTVKKAGKGVEITDESVLSGYGDPIGEATRQLALSIADKIDSDLLTAALTTTQTIAAIPFASKKLTVAGLESALALFNDEDDQPAVLVVNPADATDLRNDAGANYLSGTEVGAAAIVSGVFGEVLGVQIVRSNKVTKGAPVIIKAGALRLVMKRAAAVETDRDIVKKTNVITADEHYAAYLYDLKKVVKITTALA